MISKMSNSPKSEPRCPCILLLDTSGSMKGQPIQALNEGLHAFGSAIASDSLASRRVEIAIVTFDTEVNVAQDFVTADQFVPPTLTAQGSTNMGGGIAQALLLLEQRKSSYKVNGIPYYRPWVFMITDGAPDPGYEGAAREIQSSEENKKIAFFAVGVEGADMGEAERNRGPTASATSRSGFRRNVHLAVGQSLTRFPV